MTEHRLSILAGYLAAFPGTSEEAALRLLIQAGLEIAEAEEGSLLLLDREANALVFAMTVGNPEAEKGLRGQTVPLGSGLAGLAAVTGEVQVGTATYLDVKQTHRKEDDRKVPEAVLAAPIFLDEEVVGVMTAVDFNPGRRFGMREARIFGMFGRIAGLIVEQRRLLSSSGNPQNEGQVVPEALLPVHHLQGEILSAFQALVKSKRTNLTGLLEILKGLSRMTESE